MIQLLPQKDETLIVPHDWDVVLQRLREVTADGADTVKPSSVLAGWIKDDRFQLIIRHRRMNSFMPMVEGRIDPTSGGCLIFLHYSLLPVTRMYLILWTIIALVSGICLAIFYDSVLLGLWALIVIVLIHGIAWANFKIHLKPLHAVIFDVLA